LNLAFEEEEKMECSAGSPWYAQIEKGVVFELAVHIFVLALGIPLLVAPRYPPPTLALPAHADPVGWLLKAF
jgi:hypothetical protein